MILDDFFEVRWSDERSIEDAHVLASEIQNYIRWQHDSVDFLAFPVLVAFAAAGDREGRHGKQSQEGSRIANARGLFKILMSHYRNTSASHASHQNS